AVLGLAHEDLRPAGPGWAVGASSLRRAAEAPEGLGCRGLLEKGTWGPIAPLGEKRSMGSVEAWGAMALLGRAGPGLPAARPGLRCLPQAGESP
ncbi:hypothetical protein NDU88_002667, partial [Pleurodeles waltl]